MSINKSLTLLAINFLLYQGASYGQEYSFSINAMYGTYQMASMKKFQSDLYQNVSSSVNVPFKITDEFPGFIGYELSANMSLKKFFFGFQLATRSTGGRISYADYSGKYNIDNKLLNFEGHGVIGTTVYNTEKLTLNVAGQIGVALTNHELSSSLQLTNQNEQAESFKFSSLNVIVAAGSELRYYILNNVFVNFKARYDLHIPGKLTYKENTNAYLENDNGEEVKVDWSGIRGGIGIGLRIN